MASAVDGLLIWSRKATIECGQQGHFAAIVEMAGPEPSFSGAPRIMQ
jgi:hypothetical protein